MLQLPSQRVCIVHLSGIGDVVNGLPVVNALVRDDPDRHITWIVESTPAPILQHHPAVDQVITYDRRKGLREILALRRSLRGTEFDLVLNLGIYFKSAIPTFLARAPHKLSFGRGRARDLVWLFADHRLPPAPRRTLTEDLLRFAEHLGIATHPVEYRLEPTEDERARQAAYFDGLSGRAAVALIPTAGREAKDWPVDRWAGLATALDRELGLDVILLGGPGARERRRADAVARATQARVRDELGEDLRRLIWILDGCDLAVAPDTGPLHIARAVETPVIGLYGHTDPRTAGPYGLYRDLVIDRCNFDAPGRPADLSGDPERARRMPLITVAHVLDRVRLALDRHVRSQRARPARTEP